MRLHALSGLSLGVATPMTTSPMRIGLISETRFVALDGARASRSEVGISMMWRGQVGPEERFPLIDRESEDPFVPATDEFGGRAGAVVDEGASWGSDSYGDHIDGWGDQDEGCDTLFRAVLDFLGRHLVPSFREGITGLVTGAEQYCI